MTKITEVEVQNILKIQYALLNPQDDLTVIGGDNAQGKSSLLNAVAMALGGKRLCPEQPIRDGEATGTVKVKLAGDDALLLPPSTVIRHFSRRADGSIRSEMEIISDDGYAAPEPQTLLNRLLTNSTFDPLYFSRLKPADQTQQLRELAGFNDQPLRDKRASAYATRTVVGRDVKQLEGQYAAMPWHSAVPQEPLQSAAILEQLNAARRQNAEHEHARQCLAQEEAGHQALLGKIVGLRDEILRLQQEIEIRQQEASRRGAKIAAERARVDTLSDVDESVYATQLAELDQINQRVRANQQRAAVSQQLTAKRERYTSLTAEIESIDAAIADLYAHASWPIEGLGFTESGITYQGRPFEQCSSAEQLRVSVAIGFASNPGLKMLIIRDGSLLDQDNLQQVAALAAEHGGQVFLERVGQGSECHLILRDGRIVGQDQPAAPVSVEELQTAEGTRPELKQRRTASRERKPVRA